MADVPSPSAFRDDIETLTSLITRIKASNPKMNSAQQKIYQKALTGHTATLVYLKDDEDGTKVLEYLKDQRFIMSQEAMDKGTKDPHGILIKWGSTRKRAIRQAAKQVAESKGEEEPKEEGEDIEGEDAPASSDTSDEGTKGEDAPSPVAPLVSKAVPQEKTIIVNPADISSDFEDEGEKAPGVPSADEEEGDGKSTRPSRNKVTAHAKRDVPSKRRVLVKAKARHHRV